MCFLLSDWARAITAEILHVDGGFHAVGMPPLAGEPVVAAGSQDGAPRRDQTAVSA